MRILIVEDDEHLRTILKQSFEGEMYTVDTAPDGDSGSYIARTNSYDVILLDNMLPKKDGLTVCTEIREHGINTPIILVSVLSDSTEKVRLIEHGADDYITKPFSFEELKARIHAVVRRPYNIKQDTLRFDDVTIDTGKQVVTKGEKRIYLTRKEFMLLECLAKNEGEVVSRGQIFESVWEKDANPFSNTIETHVRNLRKKLSRGKRKKLIHTVSGRGYKLEV